MRELAQLQRYANELQGLVGSAQAKAPQRAEGMDPTRTVEVTLGADGSLDRITVASDWRSYLAPEAIGDAIETAFKSASDDRTEAWSRALERSGWAEDPDRSQEDGEVPPPGNPLDALPDAYRRSIDEAAPRALAGLAEDVLGLFDKIGEFTVPATVTATGAGTNASQTVVIKLSKSGLEACTVDARWAAQQDGTRLTNGLNEALASARQSLSQVADAPAPTARLDQLLGEALALLHHPERLAES